MSFNSSSLDDPALPPHFFSNASSSHLAACIRSRPSVCIFFSLVIANLLLLPLPVLVLLLGFQRRRTAASASHSDIITYHNIFMQTNEFLGFLLFFCGVYHGLQGATSAGHCMLAFGQLGEALFHLLTCVERYLAVVHPVTYRGLRWASGVRIRNAAIGCVWLLSFGWSAVAAQGGEELTYGLYYCIMSFLLSVVSFCSVSVLCTLRRPGPGGVGGARERVDQSKQRAFHSIVVIMVVLLLRFFGNLVSNMISSYSELSSSTMCLVLLAAFWFDLPNSFVLPLLFLQRAGKLPWSV